MKDKEFKLLKKVFAKAGAESYRSGCAIEFLEDKQHYYYLQKWSDKGWWDWGVSLRTGWFTDFGIVEVSKILNLKEQREHE